MLIVHVGGIHDIGLGFLSYCIQCCIKHFIINEIFVFATFKNANIAIFSYLTTIYKKGVNVNVCGIF